MIYFLLASPITKDTLPNIFKPAALFTNFGGIMSVVIPLVMVGASIVLLFLLILGSFKLVAGGDNPESFQSAKNLFKYAILGFIVVIISFLIVRVIGYITSVKIPI